MVIDAPSTGWNKGRVADCAPFVKSVPKMVIRLPGEIDSASKLAAFTTLADVNCAPLNLTFSVIGEYSGLFVTPLAVTVTLPECCPPASFDGSTDTITVCVVVPDAGVTETNPVPTAWKAMGLVEYIQAIAPAAEHRQWSN